MESSGGIGELARKSKKLTTMKRVIKSISELMDRAVKSSLIA